LQDSFLSFSMKIENLLECGIETPQNQSV